MKYAPSSMSPPSAENAYATPGVFPRSVHLPVSVMSSAALGSVSVAHTFRSISAASPFVLICPPEEPTESGSPVVSWSLSGFTSV